MTTASLKAAVSAAILESRAQEVGFVAGYEAGRRDAEAEFCDEDNEGVTPTGTTEVEEEE